MPTRPQDIPIQRVINALLDDSTLFPPKYLYRFSDLEGAELQAMQQTWPRVNPSRRIALMDDLEELADSDTLVDFDNFARSVLIDSEPGVRSRAIPLLWENEGEDLIPVFMDLLENDPSIEVRAAAATGLGKYIYLGELEEIPEKLLHQVEERLIETERGSDDILVRRRVLESLGFSSREEASLFIQVAYEMDEPDWLASALFAMGRSYDQGWEADVKRMLRHPKANVQLEAVRAAGELELESTRRILLDLLEEEAQDTEIRFAAIWSLSQIGGEEIRERLDELLAESEDDEEIEWIENALDNLTLTETELAMNLLDIDLEDKEMLGKIIDLSQSESEEEPDEIEEELDELEDDDLEQKE